MYYGLSAICSRAVIVLPVVCAALFVVCMGTAVADSLPSQFGTLGPLPGEGYAVDSKGNLDGLGALQINVPVAYNPKAGYVVVSGSIAGNTNDKSNFKNGTLTVGGSIGGWPRLWFSAMGVNSSEVVANGQISVLEENKSLPGIAVGFQGLFKQSDARRWGYAIATKGLPLRNGNNVYVTAGIRGGSSNVRGIGGLSYPLSESFNFATEWDGYQFNNALAWRPAGRKGSVTLLGGYNGKTGWQAGASISHNFSL
ncbi:MAG: hypothetical protein ACYC64_03085 [Armatimonadota bacterium]